MEKTTLDITKEDEKLEMIYMWLLKHSGEEKKEEPIKRELLSESYRH